MSKSELRMARIVYYLDSSSFMIRIGYFFTAKVKDCKILASDGNMCAVSHKQSAATIAQYFTLCKQNWQAPF